MRLAVYLIQAIEARSKKFYLRRKKKPLQGQHMQLNKSRDDMWQWLKGKRRLRKLRRQVPFTPPPLAFYTDDKTVK